MLKRGIMFCFVTGILLLACTMVWPERPAGASPFTVSTPTPAPTSTPQPTPTKSAKPTPKSQKAKSTPKPKKAAPTPKPINAEDYKKEMQRLVIDARKERNLRTLTVDKKFNEAADTRANEIAQKFSHNRPDGSLFNTVYNKLNGENILTLSENPKLITSAQLAQLAMDSWMDSPSHEKVMMYPSFKVIGFGYYFKDGIYYLVQEFGY